MKTYKIWEGNLERLNKKLTTIKNKCAKYGCDFHYAEVGEEFNTYKDEDTGAEHVVRYVIVETEGTAVINDWEFVGRIEHADHGNILSLVTDIEVPSIYYTVSCKCDHCKTDRVRNDTYLVKNTKTGEFKQVGKSCLKDFTCGMSAELVALYLDGMKELEESNSCSIGHLPTYYETDTILAYAVEMIKHFGYVSSTYRASTKEKIMDYIDAEKGIGPAKMIEEVRAEIARVGFDYKAKDVVEKAKAVREYFKTVDVNNNTYLNNLNVVSHEDYITYRNIGLLVSSVQAYDKAMGKIAKENERKEALAKESKESAYVGNIGDKITVEVKECKVLYSFDTSYSYYNTVTTYCYKFVDNDGNVYTWKTSKDIDVDNVVSVKGTVKAHNEYKGVKQTELTRCKVEELPREETHEEGSWDDSVLDMMYA